MAQRFDVGTLQLAGEPMQMAEVAGSTTDHAAFSVSDAGVLAFGGDTSPSTRLTWFSRTGTPLEPVVPPGNYVTVRLSPDQSQLAFSRVDELTSTPDIWLLDLARGIPARFTVDSTPSSMVASWAGLDTHPVWSPDGQRVMFRSYRSGIGELYVKVSTSGPGEKLIPVTGYDKVPADWSADGRIVVYGYQAADASSRFDIWSLAVADGVAKSYLSTAFTEMHARLSPDGRYIAFASDESGQFEVYVQSFPAAERRWSISQGGGAEPVWRTDGRELFYLRADGTLMAVPVRAGRDLEPGVPIPLFQSRVAVRSSPYRFNYDVASDGQRFLVNAAVEPARPRTISVVLDWASGLSR